MVFVSVPETNSGQARIEVSEKSMGNTHADASEATEALILVAFQP